jgi:acid phosphatase (class A)
MNFPFRALLLATILVPAFLPLGAKDTSIRWLTPDQEQALVAAVPPAPAPGSPTDQDDLAGVLKAQKERTPEQAAQVLAERHAELPLFQTVLGPDFDSGHDPKIFLLMKDVVHDAAVTDEDAKKKWNRPRPYVGHPDVVQPVYRTGAASYPSGHAVFAYTSAVLLAEIFPDKKDALFARAAEIARDRVIGGVHYPSDILEGEKLGRAVAAALLADPSFEQDLAATKTEAGTPAGK